MKKMKKQKTATMKEKKKNRSKNNKYMMKRKKKRKEIKKLNNSESGAYNSDKLSSARLAQVEDSEAATSMRRVKLGE